jgi:hypothetical protein
MTKKLRISLGNLLAACVINHNDLSSCTRKVLDSLGDGGEWSPFSFQCRKSCGNLNVLIVGVVKCFVNYGDIDKSYSGRAGSTGDIGELLEENGANTASTYLRLILEPLAADHYARYW